MQKEVLEILNIGDMYIIDDMLQQENWPERHEEKSEKLINNLKLR